MSVPARPNPQIKVGLILMGVMLLFFFVNLIETQREDLSNLKFSEFMQSINLPEGDTKKIVAVTFKDNEILAERQDGSKVKIKAPHDPELRKDLLAKNIGISYEMMEESGFAKAFFLNALPLILMVLIFFLFFRNLQAGGGKAMSFGKSRAKMSSDHQTRVTFADVAGIDEAKTELEEIIDFLKDPKKFTRLGGRIPKGVLLVGSPGTGKTILAKAIAGEAGVPFFSISGSDFVEMFVGVGASRVRDLFEQAKRHAPCIIFIDEIDAVGRQRGAGLGGGHDEREQTLNQLLVEMDGFESNEGVILIAATNRADVLDPALLRPGRFDRRVYVPKPDIKGRLGILSVHTKGKPLSPEVDLQILAQGTPGFSGADLENLANEAALIAARYNGKELNMQHFEWAKDKVLMGPERKSMIIGENEKRHTAYHESGHALVARLVDGADPVHKVSIIPRGQALGVTVLLPTEDRLTVTKSYAEGIIAYAMGGRAAEELIFGQYTTGAGDDIKKATDLARKMVCSWGMSDKIGPLAMGSPREEVFLGRELSSSDSMSEKVLEDIDAEVKRLVTEGYSRALKICQEHKAVLERMTDALLIREVIEAKELERIFLGEDIISAEERSNYERSRAQRASELATAKAAKAAYDAKPRAQPNLQILPQSS